MNSCKHCGKEIDDKHLFCSKSCAAHYNNVRRGPRKPWTEEQKRNTSRRRRILNDNRRSQQGKSLYYSPIGELLEHTCKYCGKPSGTGTVCEECKKYNRVSLYKKLGLLEGSLRDRDEKAFSILYKAYFQDKLSVQDIFRVYGICHSVLKTLFNRHGIQLRSIREGVQLGVFEGKVHLHVSPKGNQYRHGKHVTWEGKEIYYRSSYELKYAEQLDSQRVKYEVESKRIKYYSSKDQKVHIAVPDFYLPDTNELVEIKSSWTYDEQNMKDKFKAYRDSGYNPILILEGRETQI